MILQANDTIVLELIAEHHAEWLCQLTNTNRTHLRTWLSWVDHMQTVADFRQFIFDARTRFRENTEVPLVILVDGVVAGRIGLNKIDTQHKLASIGYWLGESFQGKGVVTAACRQIIHHAFTHLYLNRLELKCGIENYRSRAIAERLQFTKEGILRQAEWVNDHFIDLNLYSLLKEEWKELYS